MNKKIISDFTIKELIYLCLAISETESEWVIVSVTISAKRFFPSPYGVYQVATISMHIPIISIATFNVSKTFPKFWQPLMHNTSSTFHPSVFLNLWQRWLTVLIKSKGIPLQAKFKFFNLPTVEVVDECHFLSGAQVRMKAFAASYKIIQSLTLKFE